MNRLAIVIVSSCFAGCAPAEKLCGPAQVHGVSNLASLVSCTAIDGELEIDHADLAALPGLSNLRCVGSLSIHDNPRLESLDGLRNLTHAYRIEIEDNPMLTSVELPALHEAPVVRVAHNG